MSKKRLDIFDKIIADNHLAVREEQQETSPGQTGEEVELARILPDPTQPRSRMDADGLRELADSIRAQGVLQPILLRTLPDNRYMVVVGHRRREAAELAGLRAIPARILPSTLTAQQLRLIQLIENLQREDLSLKDLSGAVLELAEQGLSQRKIAEAISKSLGMVNLYLRVARDPQALEAISAGQLTLLQYKQGQVFDDRTVDPESGERASKLAQADQSRVREQIPATYRWIASAEMHLNRLLAHKNKLDVQEREWTRARLLQLREATDRAITDL